MALGIGSLVLIALAAGYFILNFYKHKEALHRAIGKAIITLFAVVTSTAFSIVAIQVFEYNVYLSFVVSMLFVICVGYAAGNFYRVYTIWNTILTGILGAILGMRFGMTLYLSSKVIFIADVLLIMILFLLLKIVEWQSSVIRPHKRTKTPRTKKTNVQTVVGLSVIYSLFVCSMGILLFVQKDTISLGQIGQTQSQEARYDEVNDLQTARIELNAGGFNPKQISFKKSIMIKAVFVVSVSSDVGMTLVSNDLHINAPLKSGENVFLLNNPQPGTYAYSVGSKSIQGTFTVK